jgi:hypothetical protein
MARRMKSMLLLLTIALAMSAQDFHGISIADGPKDTESGAVMPLVVNNTAKTVVGFAVQRNTTGVSPIDSIVGFQSIARGTGILPGERRAMPGIGMFAFDGEGDFKGYSVKAVLFDDMTFIGPEEVYRDFSERISTIRSMARDVQYSNNRVAVLEGHRSGRGSTTASVNVNAKALQHRASMAGILLLIQELDGDAAMDAAVTRLSALPDVTKGEEK